MQLLTALDALDHAAYPKPVLALGNFDGVHLGHQAIFRHVVTRARQIGGTSMVFTFDPHPQRVLAPEKAPPLLTTFEQKMRLIEALGIEVALRVPFTKAFAQQEPLAFIRDVLCGRIGVYEIVVGYDFRFGHGRSGTAALLQEQAPIFGYHVTVIPPIRHRGLVVSSSNVRRLLQEGQVEEAAHLLGRYYAIEGEVVKGFGRGVTLGFPTANLRPLNEVLPRPGVYAVRVMWQARCYAGVANVGYNPTFGNQALGVEVHLFDFRGDLYGARLSVEFLQRLRDERRFASAAELAAQIAKDVEQARTIHAHLASLS